MIFPQLCQYHKIPKPVPEFKFHPTRKFRFDFAWPEYKVALEVEGGVWVKGRHTRGQGFINDLFKYNSATMLGWRILRITPDQLTKTETFTLISNTLFNVNN